MMIFPSPKKSTRRRSPFTLIELLAALAVFSIMMLLLMRFTNVANTAWSQSAANMRVFDKARVALDLIDQDLQGAVLSNDPGKEIKLATGTDGGDTFLTFVSTTGDPTGDPAKGTCCASKLVEVSYKLDTGSGILQRREVGDNADTDWDFLGAPSGWHNTAPANSYEEVITGVDSFSMDVVPDTTTPKYVRVTLTLFDEQAPTERKNQTKRTFTKTVFLNQ